MVASYEQLIIILCIEYSSTLLLYTMYYGYSVHTPKVTHRMYESMYYTYALSMHIMHICIRLVCITRVLTLLVVLLE